MWAVEGLTGRQGSGNGDQGSKSGAAGAAIRVLAGSGRLLRRIQLSSDSIAWNPGKEGWSRNWLLPAHVIGAALLWPLQFLDLASGFGIIFLRAPMKKLITSRRWKDHLRRRQVSELRRRTRVKAHYRAPKPKRGYLEVPVPSEFSIIHNPEEMTRFLRDLRSYARTRHVSLDFTGVTLVTPEAIAALAATISSSSLPDTNFRGNLPSDPAARQTLLESGFFEHVRSMVPLPSGRLGKITERKSNQVEPATARELISCGTSQAFGAKRQSHATRAAYSTLIELMANTHNHAAGKRAERETWWATAYGDANRSRVCYSFLDTGIGIFRSVKVHWLRRAFRKIGVVGNPELLVQILKGQVESRTGLAYRGKGLPTVFRKSRSGDLKSLFIIANDVHADVSNDEYSSIDPPFPGTLLYWESEEQDGDHA